MDQLSERTTATEETEAISRQLSTDKERMVFENKRYQKKLDELNKVISDSKTVIEENHKQMLENESRAEDLLRELSDREQKLADATREVHLKDKELTALSNRNNENIERIDNLTQDYETTLAQLKDREQILSVLTNKQDVNNTSVDSANAEISALRAQLDRMNSELEEAKDRYYNSNNHVELLLNTSRQATPKKAIQSISGQMNDFLEANSYNNMLSQSYPPPSGSQRNTPMKGNITVDDNILVADRFTMGIDLPIQSDSNSILSGHDSSENNEKKTDKVRPPRPSESPPRVNRKQSQSVDTYNNHSINNQKINQSANFDTTSSKASEPTLRNSRDGILASKLFQELEQRAKRAEIKCHLLTQQINSIPVSLAVAMVCIPLFNFTVSS